MWTDKNRPIYNRDYLRYPSYVSDDEWAVIAPLIPPAKRGGGKRRADMRAAVNGIMYILSTGCQWRHIPKDLPPRSTLHDYLTLWEWDGTLDRIHHALYIRCREKVEREASPTACIVDSQSVKSAEKGGRILIRTALTRASRSRERSGIFWSICKVCFCMASSHLPAFRIVTAASCCYRLCSGCFRFSKNFLPTAPTKGRSFTPRWRQFCLASKRKS